MQQYDYTIPRYANTAYTGQYITYAPQAKTYNTIKNIPKEIYVKNGLIKEGADKYVKAEETDNYKKNKKLANSALLTIGTVVGLAVLGNRSSNSMAKLGQKVDDLLTRQNWYKSLVNSINKAKTKIKDFFFNNKNQTIRDSVEDLSETFKTRHAKPSMNIAKGYGQGIKSIFAITPVDILQTSLKKVEKANPGQGIKSLEKLVGKDKASTLYKELMNEGTIKDNIAFCDTLTNSIAKNFNLLDKAGKPDKKQLLNFFLDLQKGNAKNVDFSEFTKVKMNETKGFFKFMGNWWPVNIIDNIGKKISGNSWKGFGRGNLGDSLVKFNSVNGTMADTVGGKLTQNLLTVPCETISNFVNDKSGMGVLLSLLIGSLYYNVQDAPKGKKGATIANDFAETVGAMTITTPLAFTAAYGLASLKNLDGKTKFTKFLRLIGRFFGFGHDTIGKNGKIIKSVPKKGFLNKLHRFSGHSLRLVLILFVLSSLISKPITKGIHKIFGKPYDPYSDNNNNTAKKYILPKEIYDMPEIQELMKDPEAAKLLRDPSTIKALATELGIEPETQTNNFLDITSHTV